MNWTRDEREWSQQHRRSPVLRYSVVFYIILQLHKKKSKNGRKEKKLNQKNTSEAKHNERGTAVRSSERRASESRVERNVKKKQFLRNASQLH